MEKIIILYKMISFDGFVKKFSLPGAEALHMNKGSPYICGAGKNDVRLQTGKVLNPEQGINSL